jgi:hypothetical protein
MPAIGNAYVLAPGSSDFEDTGEPFAILVMDGVGTFLVDGVLDNPIAGSATVIITEIKETVYKIPDKFIDKDFRITVNLSADGEMRTADKTYHEIRRAYREGRNITLLYNSLQNTYLYYLSETNDSSFTFMCVVYYNGNINMRTITIDKHNDITLQYGQINAST